MYNKRLVTLPIYELTKLESRMVNTVISKYIRTLYFQPHIKNIKVDFDVFDNFISGELEYVQMKSIAVEFDTRLTRFVLNNKSLFANITNFQGAELKNSKSNLYVEFEIEEHIADEIIVNTKLEWQLKSKFQQYLNFTRG